MLFQVLDESKKITLSEFVIFVMRLKRIYNNDIEETCDIFWGFKENIYGIVINWVSYKSNAKIVHC